MGFSKFRVHSGLERRDSSNRSANHRCSPIVVVAAEIGGGLALIFGVFTRFVSLSLIPLMIGALIVHRKHSP